MDGWIALVALVTLMAATAWLVAHGKHLWQAQTKRLLRELESARQPVTPSRYTPQELVGLPEPVQKFFRTVLTPGQPLVSATTVEHAGQFNTSMKGEQWKPFRSRQRVVTRRPGFVWDARVRFAPGFNVRVHDAYVAGRGILTARLFGWLKLTEMPDSPELAKGELMRFFAESAWYPTVLLPSQGVQWEAVDDTSARATLQDGNITLTMLFRFHEDGWIRSVYVDDRGRLVGNEVVPTPWEGRWGSYERREGMLIPTEGEVAWLLPEGRKAYWRARIVSIEYEYSDH